MTGDHRYEEAYETPGRRPSNMCEVMEAAERKGREQGLEQGRIKATIKTLNRYVRRKLPIDSQVLADIAEDNDLTVERVREIAKENNVVLPC
jgi:predicted transposase YdaD